MSDEEKRQASEPAATDPETAARPPAAEAAPPESAAPNAEERAVKAPPVPPGRAEPAGEPRHVYCSQCGAAMKVADRYCHSCGWDTQAPALTPPPPRVVANPSDRNRLAALLLCLFLGWLGAHRFYAGKVGTGILWLFTAGLFLIGVVYDLILIATGEFRDDQGRPVVRWE